MGSSKILVAVLAVLCSAAPLALAELETGEAPEDRAGAAEALEAGAEQDAGSPQSDLWDALPADSTAPAGSTTPADSAAFTDSPGPAAPSPGAEDSFVSESALADPRAIELGPKGVDEQGRSGRVHRVAKGDTLWDISEAYLGTPWVWPSVWQDNREIENPHFIEPGDRIWITSTLMRRITEDEAAQYLSSSTSDESSVAENSQPLDGSETWDAAVEESDGSLMADGSGEQGLAAADTPEESGRSREMVQVLVANEVDPAMDPLPVTPSTRSSSVKTGEVVRVSWREDLDFMTSDHLDASSSVLGTSEGRKFLAQGDEVYIGLGEGEVNAGDEFTIFRDLVPVHDLETDQLLGYHVDVIGWGQVTQVKRESSLARIRRSTSEIEKGDRVFPRRAPSLDIDVRTAPTGFEGKIVYLPQKRRQMARQDAVYLNRGGLHGVDVGMALEVYLPGARTLDKVQDRLVELPDQVIAHLVVVTVQPDTSVAMITYSSREIEIGSEVRSRTRKVVAAR